MKLVGQLRREAIIGQTTKRKKALHGRGGPFQRLRDASERSQTRKRASRCRAYLGGAGVNPSRLRPGSGLGLGFGAFLTSFLPLSLLPMPRSVTQKGVSGKDQRSRIEILSGFVNQSLSSIGGSSKTVLKANTSLRICR